GKFALVTGAARGIGRSIANTLVANGATVAYADIDFATAKQSAATAPGSLAVEIDISNEQSVESALAKVMKQFGRLDILVNNAGINTAKHRVNIDQFPLDEWQRILDVDLTGLFLVSRAASRAMVPKKSGRIINISSAIGVVAARLQCAFAAAKAGVVHLTRAM